MRRRVKCSKKHDFEPQRNSDPEREIYGRYMSSSTRGCVSNFEIVVKGRKSNKDYDAELPVRPFGFVFVLVFIKKTSKMSSWIPFVHFYESNLTRADFFIKLLD